MYIHINTTEFVIEINDSVLGRLTSRVNCPFAALCSLALPCHLTAEIGNIEPSHLKRLANLDLSHLIMLKTTTMLYI